MSIYKIAKETGYSSSTVARALSGKGYVSEETRKRIFEAAEKFDYRPNLSARSLRNNKTQRILLGIPDICNPFYFRIIRGASETLEKNGYYVMLYATDARIEKEEAMIDLLKQKYCDGLIMVSFDFNERNIAAVRRADMPVVLMNRYLGQKPDDNFDYIYVDHIAGMESAASHLLDRGCKDVVVILGDMRKQTSFERFEGYERAFRKRGLPVDRRKLLHGGFNLDRAYAAFKKYVESGEPFDGVIASNDLAAFGVLKYCRECGLDVPRDFRLVSFDNTDYAVVCNPTLTSVDMCQYDLGRSAAEVLIERFKGRTQPHNVTLMPQLIVRQSS